MHIVHVVGARPNFMKVAPVVRALSAWPEAHQTIVHTGQHYDANMSTTFFRQLDIPEPDVNLEVGSGSHAVQTAQVMIRLEATLIERRPDLVLVYGDVNSTLAAALVAAKLPVALGHVEAGLRSGDRTMPEEVNRIVTDRLAQLHFTPSKDADEHLASEGVDPSSVFLVGNVMIDTLVRLLPTIDTDATLRGLGLLNGRCRPRFALVTLHRPSNVDEAEGFFRIMRVLVDLADTVHVVFPVHPRTRVRFDMSEWRHPRLRLVDPVGYCEFLALQREAALVITDSGGVQEETTYLGVPCLTVRSNTERPATVTIGTNTLVGLDAERLRREIRRILDGQAKKGQIPPLWDGLAAERVAAVIMGVWMKSGRLVDEP